MTTSRRPSNRLAREKSPYLLQHAYNPVAWHAWGSEAFETATREDKPVFLSIGYSTCHWCHVMEKESFEDEEVARLLNANFVCVKVDREERPDVDGLYMHVCHMMTGSGGWPLTIMLTPDYKPFFAATYIAKESRFGRMGMKELIPRVGAMWREQRKDLLSTAERVVDALHETTRETGVGNLGAEDLQATYGQLVRSFDPRFGGFGNAPKFPTAHNLQFLLRYWKRSGNEDALRMVDKTLTAMRHGGIYDHIGFGFHRYSTDSKWLVPHFEKMLYDQALLIMTYTEAYQAMGGKKDWAATVREIVAYVRRDMTSRQGGFYSAEDADSEGVEGKFYLWSADEIRDLLDKDAAELVIDVFGVKDDGNFNEEASGEQARNNILHLSHSIAQKALGLNVPWGDLERRLEEARRRLFATREQRIHPHKDDKILTDWNGLMIAALAKAGAALEEPEYTAAAAQAVTFILDNMTTGDGRLLHRWRDGEAAVPGFLDDYAFTIWGLIELYQATFDESFLERALTLQAVLREDFWDDARGGFFFSSSRAEELLLRKKEIYDGAIPSGNSVAVFNLVRLSRLTGDHRLEETANALVRTFAPRVSELHSAHTHLMGALDFALGPTSEVVIVGAREADDTREMLRLLREGFFPEIVVILKPIGDSSSVERLVPFTTSMSPQGERATAFVCRDFHCEAPSTEPGALVRLLTAAKTGG